MCRCVEQVEALRSKVFGTVKPKTLYGQSINGSMLANLADIYCSALNTNQAPTIKNAWERVAETQCQDACDKAVELYKASVARELQGSGVAAVFSGEQLMQLHSKCLNASLDLFDSEAVKVKS